MQQQQQHQCPYIPSNIHGSELFWSLPFRSIQHYDDVVAYQYILHYVKY